MKLWIPKCGDVARLDSSWTFHLYNEYRNSDLTKKIATNLTEKLSEYTVLAGTELVFDRVYIRQDNDEYASVTFIVKDATDEDLLGSRFWAKLDDVNKIECTPTSTGNPVGGFAKAKYKHDAAAKKDPRLLDKAVQRKKLQEELNVIRARCMELAQTNFGPIAAHIDNIVKAVAVGSYDRTYIRQKARSLMCYGPCRKSDADVWVCTQTIKNPDGSTTRHMRFSYLVDYGTYQKKKYSGFSITTKDGVVIADEILV